MQQLRSEEIIICMFLFQFFCGNKLRVHTCAQDAISLEASLVDCF